MMSDDAICGQRLDIIEGEIQSIRQADTHVPRNTEDNPRRDGKEHVNAISLHSSKTLTNPNEPIQKKDNSIDIADDPLDENEPEEKIGKLTEPVVEAVPFPSRLVDKQRRDKEEFVSFLNLFKSLNVNLSLLELIDKIPKYTKYLKEIMSRHKKLKKGKQTNINASCSAIIARKIHPKLKSRDKTLCNLGASINLMPLSTYSKLGLGELKNMSITLQLADKSLVRSKCVLEDVLVKVRSSIIPVKFFGHNFEEEQENPILLGRCWKKSGSKMVFLNSEK
ncbi:Integrase, catalytic core [Gossypium australe]|uniref:Integrase, catalytic core n=1 Tax=Gossypium australe TaxID=47621 RepID=A0A5B6WPR7_9ROSI|nr:Integrase, catalytic core [Gossypium australe]